jgi:Ala-tRNA(Pro) deacylase
MTLYEKILALLKSSGVPFEHYEHERVHTSVDAAKVRGVSLTEGAKAIILVTGSKKIIQCVVRGHRRVDLKKLKILLNEKNISLADHETVLSATTCTVGSVPPFGNLFDPPVPVYADQALFEKEHIVFSAATHHHSIKMRSEDWLNIVQPVVVDLGKENETKL